MAGTLTRDRPQISSATIAGTKMITGTDGCTRESASSTLERNIRGDARSAFVLLMARSSVPSAQLMSQSCYPFSQ